LRKAELQRLSDPVYRLYQRRRNPFLSRIFGWLLLLALECGSVAGIHFNLYVQQYLFAALYVIPTVGLVKIAQEFIRDSSLIRILPYFDKPVPGHTFLRGEALARNSKELDSIAESKGLKPISYFGFNDDMWSESVQWHDPKDGLATISALITAVGARFNQVNDRQDVLSDLGFVRDALIAAEHRGARFCFLLRLGGGFTLREIETRQGYFENEWKSRDDPKQKKQ